MKHAGFITPWMNTDESDVLEVAPLTKIVNEIPEKQILPPAIAELFDRIELTETVIKGEKFAEFSEEQKQEFISEHSWLIAIKTQLLG